MLNRTVFAVALTTLSLSAFAQRRDTKEPSSELRPEEMSVGVGVGYAFSQSSNSTTLLNPNQVSVRVRFGKIAIEPIVSLGGSTGGTGTNSSTTNGTTTTTTDQQDKTGGLDIGLTGNVRYALASAGPVDFVGIGGLSVTYGSNTTNFNTQQTTTTSKRTDSNLGVGLAWGIGVEWFITRNLVLSADASNPLVSWSQTTRVDEASNSTNNTSSRSTTSNQNLDYGLIFDPRVRLMFHLFF